MGKAEASVEELVGMIERGELRLPEMQRRYVWRSTRVRDLLDSLYRGYPSGAILLWETDEEVPLQDFAIAQQGNPYQSTRLLLDGQQRLTSLSAVIRGVPVGVRGRQKPVELLFNLEHPEELAVVTEVNEEGNDEEDEEELIEDEVDSSEDELQKRFDRMTFVVATRKLEQLPCWVKVSEVFKSDSDRPFLKRAGITDLDDPRAEKYSQRLARLRGVRKYVYRMDILERALSYGEVTEIFVRVNSLGTKLRSSDLALAQITAKWRGALKTFRFLAQMYARFSPQQVVHAVGRGCGCAGSRYSAVKSSVAQSTAACAGPAIGGGPARRQPAPPQGAEALALTGRRTMKARGTRPRLSTTFYRWAKPSLTVQPPWNRQAPCDSAVYCGRIFREPATPLQIQTVFSSHVSY